MLLTRYHIHKKVIAHYGVLSQISKAREELKELYQELSYKDPDRVRTLSEMADVKNCMEQIDIMIKRWQQRLIISDDEISDEQDYKMERTLDRMKK